MSLKKHVMRFFFVCFCRVWGQNAAKIGRGHKAHRTLAPPGRELSECRPGWPGRGGEASTKESQSAQ